MQKTVVRFFFPVTGYRIQVEDDSLNPCILYLYPVTCNLHPVSSILQPAT